MKRLLYNNMELLRFIAVGFSRDCILLTTPFRAWVRGCKQKALAVIIF